MKRKFFVYIFSILLSVLIFAGLLALVLSMRQTFPSFTSKQQTHISETSTVKMKSTITPVSQNACLRPNFRCGVAFPRWSSDGYSFHDSIWSSGLHDLYPQTGARWVSIVVELYQPNLSIPSVQTNPGTPTPASVAEGIKLAKQYGYHVFVEPLLATGGPANWGGYVHYHSAQDLSTWFDSYWSTLRPYVVAAHDADQLAIGTELQGLQDVAPQYWLSLLSNVHNLYSGPLVYDLNWTSLQHSLPTWLKSPLLTYLGVSAYFPLVDTPRQVTQQEAVILWHDRVQHWLDLLAEETGKPVVITEIGYRNMIDAGYKPFAYTTTAPRDDMQQALLYNATLTNVFNDQHIAGIFFWAWQIPPFGFSKQTEQTLWKWYAS